jgi:ATP-dependent exoDNAse (exonuclease V) beta subunit
MKWSFSGLKDFDNCPRQYHETKVLKRHVKAVTQQMLYGTEVHKALEDYTRDKTPLPKNYERYAGQVDALLEIDGEKIVEHQMAMRKDGTACGFSDEDYWVRGIADLLILDGGKAYVVDYKTGSAKYPDTKQLKLMALMVFAKFPEVQEIKAALLFVAHNVFISEDYKRSDIEQLNLAFKPSLYRMEKAYETNTWTPNPTGLCGWCPVTSCEYHRKR